MEQTLNLWLRKELEVGTALLDMIRLAYSLFSSWVRFLETRKVPAGSERLDSPLPIRCV